MKRSRAHAARLLDVLEFQVTSARKRVEEWDKQIARAERRRFKKQPSKETHARHRAVAAGLEDV